MISHPHRVLVTGATGMLGNNIVRLLAGVAGAVRVLVRGNPQDRSLRGLNVEIVQGDIRNIADVRRAVAGVSHVVHAAADVTIGWRMTETIQEVNIVGTSNVAQAARQESAKLVHVSSVNALALRRDHLPADEGTPYSGLEIPCNYVLSKRAANEHVLAERERGLSATIVYPGFMLGPWDWKPSSGQMFLAVAARKSPLTPRGGCSVCDVRDVAHGIVAGLCRPLGSDHYILAGHNITYRDLWREMARIAGSRAPRFALGPVARVVAGTAGDLWGRMRGKEPLVNSAIIAMGNRFHYYDSGRAIAELDYAIRPLDATLHDAWDWLRSAELSSTGTRVDSV